MRARTAALLLVAALGAALGGRAMAQPGKEQPLDAFLEQRVAEELATDGTLLSRLGVTLEIQIVGDTVIVSLVDSTTARAVASTKVDRVPGDREAAVAQVTQVAASLAEQIAHGPARAPTTNDQEERDRRSAGEYRYGEEAVTFSAGDGYWGGLSSKNAPYIGTVHRPLSETEFFRTIDRPDLADRYQFRRRGGIATVLISSFTFVGGFALAINDSPRDFHTRPATVVPLIASGVSVIGILVGAYFITRPMPISNDEIYDLTSAHNRQLRVKYGLPLQAAPYASPDGGGVAFGGSF